MKKHGVCPECEFAFTIPPLEEGETLVCPECSLTLQVIDTSLHTMTLRAVETTLPDWGE